MSLTCARCGDDARSPEQAARTIPLCVGCYNYLGQCDREHVVFTKRIAPPSRPTTIGSPSRCRLLHAERQRTLGSD